MKNILLTSLLALAGSLTASATSVQFDCNPRPASFNSGAGSTNVACPSLNSGGPTGAILLNSVTLSYVDTYQFGGNPGPNSVKITFTPDAQGGTLGWNLPSTALTASGGFTVTSTGSGSATLSSGLALSNFASSGFNVGLLSQVTGGTIGTSSAGVQVTYDYNVTAASGVPEPATISLIGFSMVGLGVASRRRKA